jgi:deoxyribodipyrimidine photo-lyase
VPEFGSLAYPAPIVDEKAALKATKELMYGQRAKPEARAEADAVQQRHGSRKAGLPPSGMKRSAGRSKAPTAPSPQGELF